MASDETKRIAEERTPLGTGTGIELERPGESGAGEPFDPEKIEIQTRGLTIDALLKRIRAKTIDLGLDFEGRDDVWTGIRRSRLIESLLLKIPLPAVYAAEDSAENWAVVDGGQRLIAIAEFIDPDAVGRQPLGLAGLEYLGGDFDGATFGRLPGRLQRRLKETELEVHVIRHGTPEPVKFNIATRINGGATPLSGQELRHALIPGPARDILATWSQSPEFRQATGGGLRHARMADRELVLRFIAFRLTPAEAYDAADFDRFLGDAMQALNVMPEKPEPAPEPEPEPEVMPDPEPAPEMEPALDEPPIDDGAEVALDMDFGLTSDEMPAPEPAAETAVDELPEPAPDDIAAPAQDTEPEPQPESMTLERLDSEFRAAMTTTHAVFGDDAFRKRYNSDDAPNPINKALFEVVAVTLATLDADQREIIAARKESVSKLFMELMHNSSFDDSVSRGCGDAGKIRTRFAEFEKIIKKALE